MQGNVAEYLLQALDFEPFEPADASMALLVASIWCGEPGHVDFSPDLFTKTRELLRRYDLEPRTRPWTVGRQRLVKKANRQALHHTGGNSTVTDCIRHQSQRDFWEFATDRRPHCNS
jgi:hypothetical protein